MGRMNQKNTIFLILTITLGCFFVFWRIDSEPIFEWDEARHGQNALEMIINHDYINYTYAQKPDTWNNKPPLLIWSIVASYNLFGFNTFALRFPSAVMAIIILITCFLISRKFFSPKESFFVSLIMMTSKGILGYHVGRTGDMDSMLLGFFLLSVLFWIKFFDSQKVVYAILTAVFWGLSFYTKGTASIFIVPGLGLYALDQFSRNQFFPWKKILVTVSIALLFPLSWFLLIQKWGYRSTLDDGTLVHAWDLMFSYDTWSRFTTNLEGHGKVFDPLYILRKLDVAFMPWIYALYVMIFIFLIRTLFFKTPFPQKENSALKFACLFAVPIMLILSVSRSKLPWYIAPILPFLALALWDLYQRLFIPSKSKVLTLFLIIAVIHQIQSQWKIHPDPVFDVIQDHAQEIKNASQVCYKEPLHQHYRLLLSWYSQNLKSIGSRERIDKPQNGVFVRREDCFYFKYD